MADCGRSGDLGKDGNAWYDKIGAAMDRQGAGEHAFPFGTGKRVSHGNWSAELAPAKQAETTTEVTLPNWAKTEAAAPAQGQGTLSPSDLGGAKALAGDAGLDEEAAKKRGRQIHLLLEHLPDVPQASWPAQAAKLLATGEDAAGDDAVPALLAEATAVLTNAELQHLFTDQALAEVSVSATLEALQGRRIHGTIDRLIIDHDSVLAVDFKTNATVPAGPAECPLGLLRQMAAYAHALQQIYPDKQVKTALLWTRTAELMLLPETLVTQSLEAPL